MHAGQCLHLHRYWLWCFVKNIVSFFREYLHFHVFGSFLSFFPNLKYITHAKHFNHKPTCTCVQCLGRGDRMKQAKADASELVDAYRAEKQQEFNNKVLAAGTYMIFLFVHLVNHSGVSTHTFAQNPQLPLIVWLFLSPAFSQEEAEDPPQPSFRQQPTGMFKSCRDNSTVTCQKRLTFFYPSAVRFPLRFPLPVFVQLKRFTVKLLKHISMMEGI